MRRSFLHGFALQCVSVRFPRAVRVWIHRVASLNNGEWCLGSSIANYVVTDRYKSDIHRLKAQCEQSLVLI
jgi:hypothetical protein